MFAFRTEPAAPLTKACSSVTPINEALKAGGANWSVLLTNMGRSGPTRIADPHDDVLLTNGDAVKFRDAHMPTIVADFLQGVNMVPKVIHTLHVGPLRSLATICFTKRQGMGLLISHRSPRGHERASIKLKFTPEG